MSGERVRVKDYERLKATDPRLWPVPSTKGKACRLHWYAASRLVELEQAWPGSEPILVVSGWRPHRWRSWAHYVATLVKRYTTPQQKAKLSQSQLEKAGLCEGRKWLAFDSPHETGLAFDIGSNGLWPARKTCYAQKLTPLYRWLQKHASVYGLVNYHREPWHWEVPCPLELYRLSGPES
jgi:hypothetical protein